MAINIPILTEFQDRGIKSARAAFQNFQTSVGDAQGGMNKFKAGSKVALDAVKANMATLAVGAAAAFGTFALKGAQAFTDLALAAGKFAEATGLTTQQASRFMEVAGDLGIEANVLEKSINRMNVQASKSPKLFDEFGVEIAKTANGAVNANETFLNVVDRLNKIKDPAERARVATQLLGKGWQDMAELVGQGSDKLRESLKNVSDQKVIDPEEVARAREFRGAMDDLKDKFEDFAISLGEGILPLLIDFLELATDIIDLISAPDVLRGAKNIVSWANEVKGASEEVIDLEASINRTDEAWQNFLGDLDLTVAFDNLTQKIDGVFEAAVMAFSGDKNGLYEYNADLAAAAKQIFDIATQIGATNDQKNTLKILVDTRQLEAANNYLNAINKGLTGRELAVALGPGFAPRAMGGPVAGGSTYLVGERGPELFTPGTSGMITPNHALGGGGGNTITVNVNGGDPNQILRVLQQYVRQSGPLPINTRAM